MDTPGIASIQRQIKTDWIYRLWSAGMDACVPGSRRPCLRSRAALILILAFSALPLRAQPAISDNPTEIKQLFAEERWEDIVRIAEAEPQRSADLNYYYGTALARLRRLD